MSFVALLVALGVMVLGTRSLVSWWRERAARREATHVQADAVLAVAEVFVLQAAWSEALERASAIETALADRRDPESLRTRAQARLLRAECDAGFGQIDAARRGIEEARALRGKLPPGESATGLEARERCLEAGLAIQTSRGEEARAAALREIEAAETDDALWRDDLLTYRRARLATALARADLEAGSWPAARAMLERSIGIAERVGAPERASIQGLAADRERVIRALSCSHAAHACSELGVALLTMGNAEGIAWLDRAIQISEPTALPIARVALAHALIVRAAHEPAREDSAGDRRQRWLARARDAALEHDWPPGRMLASRADIHLGLVRSGASDEAAEEHFRAAAARLVDVEIPGSGELRAEAHMMLGHFHEHAGRLEEACEDYRESYAAGHGDPDPDARKIAAVCLAHRHRLLHVLERTEEAREAMEGLEALVPTLSADDRPLLGALLGRARGQQRFQEGDREAAEAEIEETLSRIAAVAGGEARDVERQLLSDSARIAMSVGNAERAERRFRDALASPSGARPEAQGLAERADLYLGLAQALGQLDRERESAAALLQAFETGRDSGRSGGRSAAAVAAFGLGNLEDDEEKRRTWYERAAAFGRLSGTPRGRKVVDAVAERRGERGA